jgi:hypothetical protein
MPSREIAEWRNPEDARREEVGGDKKMGERQRVQLDFSPEAYHRLGQIRNLADAKTNAEVVRNALRVYEWFLQQTKQEHYKIQLVKEDKVKEVELLV